MKGNLAWITSVLESSEVPNAIVLARSLRRVLTRRLIICFVSPDISQKERTELQNCFHAVYDISIPNRNGPAHCEHVHHECILRCFDLEHLNKFVYISNKLMFLKNADYIFGQNNGILMSKDKTGLLLLISASTKTARMKYSAVIENNTENNRTWKENLFPLIQGDTVIADFDSIHLNLKAHQIPIVYIQPEAKDESQNTFKKKILELRLNFLKTGANAHQVASPETLKTTDCYTDLKDSVAIIGMSFRLPGANNPAQLWKLLAEGREGISSVPEWRWKEISDRNFRIKGEAGFLSCPVDEMDSKFFGISPKEIFYMDPQQRLVLELVWEALENSCINPEKLRNTSTGVFGGWWRSDYKEILQHTLGVKAEDIFRVYMGNTIANVTSRISHFLGLTGPSISTESGCSTSMVAVHLACQSLLNEECSLALALGVNLLLHPFTSDDLPESFMARDGRCKTFDKKADGFGRAEGCTVLVLKRYADAVRDNDTVLGLIRGSAVVQEGTSSSIGTPTVDGEALAIKLALEVANVEPDQVEFVETHGTGTVVGDPMEVSAIAKSYGTNRETPLIIGSVKTNIGHTEACAGIAGIVKTLLVFQNDIIPRHINFETLNPEIDIDVIPAIIPLENIPWPRRVDGPPRIAGVSSFGVTGTDTHVILQEPPLKANKSKLIGNEHLERIMKLSAHTEEALDQLRNAFVNYLQESDDEELDSIVFSANFGRPDMKFRSYSVGKNKKELQESFVQSATYQNSGKKVCFLFTGQGSQYPGMAKDLYNHNELFRSYFDHCAFILKSKYEISIKEAVHGEDNNLMSKTVYSQTSIFVIEICLLQLWISWGIFPDVVLGHSLGEFAAAVACGILTLEEALDLVAQRGLLIEKLPVGAMLVCQTDKEITECMIRESGLEIDIAAVNSTTQTVVSGSTETIKSFKTLCESRSIKATLLGSKHAFHSRHMDPILSEYEKCVELNPIRSPKSCKFVSGMTGNLENSLSTKYWTTHATEPVEFLKASKTVIDELECNIFLEVGPQPVLAGLVAENSEFVLSSSVKCFPSLRKNEGAHKTMLNSLGKLYCEGLHVDWESVQQFSSGTKVTLPNYPFQRKQFPIISYLSDSRASHPLVGKIIPNPTHTKILQSEISLNSVSFLKDHVIGNIYLFPAAAFLEMLLVGSFTANNCLEGTFSEPNTPLSLIDFHIEAPLALEENESTTFQVTTSEDKEGNTNVAIFSKLQLDQHSTKWIKHASAIYLPYETVCKALREKLNKDTLDGIRTRCNIKNVTDNNYEKLSEVGYKFGTAFKTLGSAWKNPNSDEFLVAGELKNLDSLSENYLANPILADAMLHTALLGVKYGEIVSTLHVPVSVGKFIWYKKITTKNFYVHRFQLKISGALQNFTVLYDENGDRLALTSEEMFIETTINSLKVMLGSQKKSIPPMIELTWKNTLSPREERFNLNLPAYETLSDKTEFWNKISKNNIPGEDGEKLYQMINNLCLLYMIKCFNELGWNFSEGSEFGIEKLLSTLNIQSKYTKFISYLMEELVKENYLDKKDNETYKVVTLFPTNSFVESSIKQLISDKLMLEASEIQSICSVTSQLSKILIGKINPLSLLFPENSKPNTMGPAEIFYNLSNFAMSCHNAMKETFAMIFQAINSELRTSKSVLRILEIGAGTGTGTKCLIPYLTEDPRRYEFTYTDISSVFFKHGEEIFDNSGIKVNYKTLNIEEDVFSQGFLPHQFDMILVSHVLHATQNISESMLNIKNLAAPNAIICVAEVCKPLRVIKCLFGTLDGMNRFSDFTLRKEQCELSSEKWISVHKDLGFTNPMLIPSYFNHANMIWSRNSSEKADQSPAVSLVTPSSANKSWIVFCRGSKDEELFSNKLRTINRNLIPIYLSSNLNDTLALFQKFMTEQEKNTVEGVIFLWGLTCFTEWTDFSPVTQTFLEVCKHLSTFSVKSGQPPLKLLVLTRKLHLVDENEASGSITPYPSILAGMIRTLQNENSNIFGKNVDLPQEDDTQLNNIIDEMITDSQETTVVYRDRYRHLMRYTNMKNPSKKASLPIPNTPRFCLQLPSTNSIRDLRFISRKVPATSLEDNHIEVRVKAYSLNFRDVFAVLKPTEEFEKLDCIGCDYTGIVESIGKKVTKFNVGDEIIGLNTSNESLPSHLIVDEEWLTKLPQGMSFAEGATLPAVSATVYECLIKAAKLKAEDTVLIHTGSGGVGLCAIQIAKSIGCKIVSTAGNERKRAYLRRLGVKYVYNSRTTEYREKILEDVGGVDVVLNSLTGSGFKEATLDVCKMKARFIEMSKLNTWTVEDVKALRSDVFYKIVDISSASREDMREYMEQLKKFQTTAAIKPLPYTRFEAEDIREALTFLQTGKHIGKIILVMPEYDEKTGWKSHLFNDKSTYIITGGLGGVGMEVAKWMCTNGAKHIALLGRNEPNTERQKGIEEINSKGSQVFFHKCDVGVLEECRNVLDFINHQKLPPLRGIMHAAGVLSDASFENQTWEKYKESFQPKVHGSWNFHQLTIGYQLEFFVLFSTVVSSVGGLGQSNYSAANTFLDHLSAYRNSMGLPGLTVNWGQWGQVGMAKNIEALAMKPMSTLQAISGLELSMKKRYLRVGIVDGDFALWPSLFGSAKLTLEDLVDYTKNKKDSVFKFNSEMFWEEYDSYKDEGSKKDVVKKYIRLLVRQTLKLEETDPLNDEAAFQDLGMDSLMMIEMKNMTQGVLGQRATITLSAVKDCGNISQLSLRIHEVISGKYSSNETLSKSQLIQLIKEDPLLPDDVSVANITIPGCELPSSVKTIFLTGVTGNLGPQILLLLCQRPETEKVVCLVRPTSGCTARERLLRILNEKGVLERIQCLQKISVVEGDITQVNFGLPETQYQEVVESVDAVFNLAVCAEILHSYTRSCKSRDVNVLGTINLLKFSCRGKLKHFLHASTMMTAASMDEKNMHISELWPKTDTIYTSVNTAYVNSKYIAEVLVSEAAQRGLPIKIMRLPFLGRDSKTGMGTNLLSNHLILRMIAYMHMGVTPANNIPFSILPVDVAAEITTSLFFNDHAPFELYNISNPFANEEQEISLISNEFGFDVNVVETGEFEKKLDSMEDNDLLGIIKQTAQHKDRTRVSHDIPPSLEAWKSNKSIFYSEKMKNFVDGYPNIFPTSLELLRNDLHIGKTEGLFAKLGLMNGVKF